MSEAELVRRPSTPSSLKTDRPVSLEAGEVLAGGTYGCDPSSFTASVRHWASQPAR